MGAFLDNKTKRISRNGSKYIKNKKFGLIFPLKTHDLV